MTYTIDFNNNTVNDTFLELVSRFDWSERYFEEKDLMRNLTNTTAFESAVKHLRLFGVGTTTGSYEDDGFLRIGYACIGGHEFIKNGQLNTKALTDALWEIAHPATN